jgi:hypothetical protein
MFIQNLLEQFHEKREETEKRIADGKLGCLILRAVRICADMES